MTQQIALKTWEKMLLPTDPISMDTMCIFSQQECSDSWALLCDPQRIAITWVLTMLGQTTLVKYKVNILLKLLEGMQFINYRFALKAVSHSHSHSGCFFWTPSKGNKLQ